MMRILGKENSGADALTPPSVAYPKFRTRHRPRWRPWKAALSRHEIRLRAMWGC